MCRALAYLGPALAPAAVLHHADSSLVQQAIEPRYLRMRNLAGFGMTAWLDGEDADDEPLVYRSTTVPLFDDNLRSLAGKVRTTCMLGHVRGVPYQLGGTSFGPESLHPFRYPGTPLALCHNGGLADFRRMQPAVADALTPWVRQHVRGTTDSEWVYALLLSQLGDPGAYPTSGALRRALDRTLRILRRIREAHGIDTSSSMNLFVADGRQILALRFTFDFGRFPLDPVQAGEAGAPFLSLWATVGDHFAPDGGSRWRMHGGGRKQAAILASEPLSHVDRGWVEVSEYSAVSVTRQGDAVVLESAEVDA